MKHAVTLALLVYIAAASAPDPARDYADAAARANQRQVADDSVVAQGGRTIFMDQGHRTPRVFVLLHGFTDSPRQFEDLGARFSTRGDNVYIPRLPRHAEKTGIRAISAVTAEEFAAFGDSTADIAHGLGDTVIVIGLSAGGAIGGWMAQHRSDVFRAVLVAPAFAPAMIGDQDKARTLTEIAARLPDINRGGEPDSTRPDFGQGISTRGLAQVIRLGAIVRAEADGSPPKAPRIALLLNENDRTVNADAAIDLAKRWQEKGAFVLAYQFPKAQNLPHNLMESGGRGGDPDRVYPVLEAMALGNAPPDVVRFQWLVCRPGGCPP